MIDRRTALFSACGAILAGARASATPPPVKAAIVTDGIYELRNYTLHPGQRDVLIELFEREFVESEEALGAHVVGTFRDLDAPDHFVWLRGFRDMATRKAALSAFYGGPVWKAHSRAANATMIDSNNVFLLHPVGAPLRLPEKRPAIGAAATSQSLFIVDIYALGDDSEGKLAWLAARDPRLIAAFATERSPNNFPALPVRDENVFVAIRRFGDDKYAAIAGMPPPQITHRLRPTSRSLLR